MVHKQPNASRRFSYARIPGEGTVTYRLFRRDFTRRVHYSSKTFPQGHDRTLMAITLQAMRRELLERVDAVELELLGIAA